MRIFLTGASGLVGASLARAAARRGHEVVGTVGRFAGQLEGLAQRLAVDLVDERRVVEAVLAAAPDAIVNCAAISEPAACAADSVHSQAMNVALPATLARLAARLGVPLVHVSSEQVFSGTRPTGYGHLDPPSPINEYGRQKVASERGVLEAAPELAAVVRAPLLMGDSPAGRRSLHERLLGDWAAGGTARLYRDEFRQPCTAENLAEAMLELVERRDLRGVFHWAGADLISRYELGQRVREHFKLSETVAPIVAVTRTEAPAATRERQPCLALELSPLKEQLRTRPQTVAEQLATLKVPPSLAGWYASVRAGG